MADSTAEELRKTILFLLCVDSSEQSKQAIEWYFSNLYRKEHEVGLVHVHILPDMPGFGLFGQQIYNQVHNATYFDKDGEPEKSPFNHHDILKSVQASQAIVEREKERLSEKGIVPQVFVETMHDSIGHTICKIADEQVASCIIMGQRGLGTVRRTFLGSVSTYVLHHSKVPVVVVP